MGITEHKTRSYPMAIYYGEDDLPEVCDDAVIFCLQTVQDRLLQPLSIDVAAATKPLCISADGVLSLLQHGMGQAETGTVLT